jgi:RpiR family carbohydrate utilization transcriptional regulator
MKWVRQFMEYKRTGNESNAGVLSIIKSQYGMLTSSQQKIALYVLSNPGKILDETVEQISNNVMTSQASVVRFCKDVGFKGFQAFKMKLSNDLGADSSFPAPENISENDSDITIFEKNMAAEIESIRYTRDMLDRDVFSQSVEMLSKASKIGFFAVGSSYVTAYDAFWHFFNIGKDAAVQQDSASQILLAQSLKKCDLAFAITISGQSKIPVMALEIARENGVPTICLTHNAKSEVSNYSDCTIVTYGRGNFIRDFATTSRVEQLTVMNSIYLAVAAKDWNLATENFEKRNKLIRYQQY